MTGCLIVRLLADTAAKAMEMNCKLTTRARTITHTHAKIMYINLKIVNSTLQNAKKKHFLCKKFAHVKKK